MKQYPKYKDSGIEWIGEIPEHWVVSKLKYSLDEIIGGGTPDTSNPSYWDDENGIPWVAISDITEQEILKKTSRKISVEGKESKGLEIIPRGTLLISIFASLGKTTLLDIDASANQAILGLIPAHKLIRDYLKYPLVDVERYISYYSSSNTQENLNLTKIKNLIILLPPFPEQQTIANYLDRKTRQIDTLIEKKQKQIDLLKEQRTAITNQAVTKGLNPNVKMKDSGIEWLGVIPEHWGIKKGKYLFSIVNGYPPEQINFAEDGQHTYFRVDDLNEDGHGLYLIKGKAKFILGSTPLYQKNLILFPKRGAAILTNKVKITAIQNLFDTNLMGLNVFRNKADTEFLSYCLLTRRLDDIADTSTIPQINNKHIYPLSFPLPPLIEQKSISTFLNQHIQKTDSLILKIEKTIGHLKEYRTALISEVVTGKIDVRDLGEQED